VRADARMPKRDLDRLIHLTPFELKILRLRASGLSRTEIARIFHRSPQTISNLLTIAKEKLGAGSLIEAAVILTDVNRVLH
jgi:DNA-binding CsgD family transcriptional regulator